MAHIMVSTLQMRFSAPSNSVQTNARGQLPLTCLAQTSLRRMEHKAREDPVGVSDATGRTYMQSNL